MKANVYISSQSELERFAQRAMGAQVLAIDTEFLREKTYYPKLCLLQMCADNETAIVDPFAVSDLRMLNDVLLNERVMKVFHAATQDLEIIYHETGVLPSPLFDTQVAAALLGHTQQIGYGSLVSSVCGVQLKKGDSFTDWSRRPLSQSQLSYAADDVIYLPRMYRRMRKQLEKLGRLDWLEGDFAALANPDRYDTDVRERYKRLKRVSQLNRRQLSAAREVAAWRETKAQERDIPRKWVLTDEQVVETCKRLPKTIDDLYMVRGVSDKLSTRDARAVVAAIATGVAQPQESWPVLQGPSRNEANVDAQVDLMSALLRLRARENNIAVQTLASHSDLAQVARGHDDVDVLHGWRRQIIGAELLDLVAGRLTLALRDGNIVVTNTLPGN